MVPLKVAISGFFCYIGTSYCPNQLQELVPIAELTHI